MAIVRKAAAREPGLVAVGIAGVVLALICSVALAARGRFIPPEGKMLDAATFDFGVGVFTLTIALLLPLAGYSLKARRRWRRAYYVFAVYGLLLETIQAFRGLDPRFSEAGRAVDEMTGSIFGLTAALNTVLVTMLGLQFFRVHVLADRPTLRLGIRYGVGAVALSFGVGIAMSVNGGRHIGDHGNLLLAHAIGVHGIHALPIVALLVSVGTASRRRACVHVAGIAWLAVCVATLMQSVLDQAPLEMSALSTLIVVALTGWAASATYALVTSVQAMSWRPM